MSDDVRFDGTAIKIGDRTFVVPPLNLARIKRLRPDIEALSSMKLDAMMTDEQIESVVRILHSALSRNYPEITIDEVEDIIDLGNLIPVVQAMMRVSGFEPGGASAGSGPSGTQSTAT